MKTKSMVQKTTGIVLSKNTNRIVSNIQQFMLEPLQTLFSNSHNTNLFFIQKHTYLNREHHSQRNHYLIFLIWNGILITNS